MKKTIILFALAIAFMSCNKNTTTTKEFKTAYIDTSKLMKESAENKDIQTKYKEKAQKICSVMKERITFPNDLWEQGKVFFEPPKTFDQTIIAKRLNSDAIKVLTAYRDELKKGSNVVAEDAKQLLETVTARLEIKTGSILQALRMALTGAGTGPDLMMTIEIIGNVESASRLDYALNNIKIVA